MTTGVAVHTAMIKAAAKKAKRETAAVEKEETKLGYLKTEREVLV